MMLMMMMMSVMMVAFVAERVERTRTGQDRAQCDARVLLGFTSMWPIVVMRWTIEVVDFTGGHQFVLQQTALTLR